MKKYCAGIVLYNPEINRLNENISAIKNQVDKVILIDNNSSNIEEIKNLIKDEKRVDLIRNNQNMGIAIALNQILERANKEGYEWALTLDQDTICPHNIISEYELNINSYPDIGIICPYIIDINISNGDEYKLVENKDPEFIERCITSGSLTNVKIWEKIGGFDNEMFIDYVDFEYCKRLEINNYKILLINKVAIFHEVGKSSLVKVFNKQFSINNHSELRKYYYFRNRVYTYRKHKNYYNLTKESIKLVKCVIFLSFEKHSIKKIRVALKGINDGFNMSLKHD